MIIVESRLSARALGRGLEMPLLMSIGRGLMVALGVYGAFRLGDMAYRGVLGQAFAGSRESGFFLLEIAIGVILPMTLLAFGAVRRNSGRLYGAALLVVAGFVVNRLNVSITGFEGAQGGTYVPALAEAIVTVMLVGIGMAVFAAAVRFLPIMPKVEDPELAVPVPKAPQQSALMSAVPLRS
jgi:Ni/Fe-hydrogenase subunit HybB-like protein